MATQGCDQSADPGAGMNGAAQAAPKGSFWRESDKSREREGVRPRRLDGLVD
jgi:hypothetical protein